MKRRFTTLGKNLNQKALVLLGKEVFPNRSPEENLEYWKERPLRGIIDESLYFIDYNYGRRGLGDMLKYNEVDNLIIELRTS